jgi:hypothetical protein
MVWLVWASIPSDERRFRVAGPLEHLAALARFDRGHAFNRSPESRGGGSVVAARAQLGVPGAVPIPSFPEASSWSTALCGRCSPWAFASHFPVVFNQSI